MIIELEKHSRSSPAFEKIRWWDFTQLIETFITYIYLLKEYLFQQKKNEYHFVQNKEKYINILLSIVYLKSQGIPRINIIIVQIYFMQHSERIISTVQRQCSGNL